LEVCERIPCTYRSIAFVFRFSFYITTVGHQMVVSDQKLCYKATTNLLRMFNITAPATVLHNSKAALTLVPYLPLSDIHLSVLQPCQISLPTSALGTKCFFPCPDRLSKTEPDSVQSLSRLQPVSHISMSSSVSVAWTKLTRVSCDCYPSLSIGAILTSDLRFGSEISSSSLVEGCR
jgi:hypothetical protein